MSDLNLNFETENKQINLDGGLNEGTSSISVEKSSLGITPPTII